MRITIDESVGTLTEEGIHKKAATPACTNGVHIKQKAGLLMRMIESQKGYLEVFAAGILWGTIGPFIQLLSSHGSTSSFTSFLRMAFACLILMSITIAKFGWHSLCVDRKTLFLCALLGLVCQGTYNVCYSMAVTMTGVTVSAVLINIAPVFTALLASFLFSERLTIRKLFALLLNLFGCILVVTGGNFTAPQLSWIGVLCGVGAGLCYALTAIIGKFASTNSNAFVISTYSYLFATLSLALFFKPWETSVTITAELLFFGFLYALIPTAIAYLLYYSGLQKIKESSKVPVIASVETVAATVLGVALYNEPLDMVTSGGILLVMAAIVLMNTKR